MAPNPQSTRLTMWQVELLSIISTIILFILKCINCLPIVCTYTLCYRTIKYCIMNEHNWIIKSVFRLWLFYCHLHSFQMMRFFINWTIWCNNWMSLPMRILLQNAQISLFYILYIYLDSIWYSNKTRRREMA